MASYRSGDGAGAGMGFRGGKGKPGYPLPDTLKHREIETEIGMLEKTISDMLSKIVSLDGIVQAGESGDVVEVSDPTDLVVASVINDLRSQNEDNKMDLGWRTKATDAVMKQFSEKLASRGIDVSKAKNIGSGYNGTAYDIGSGSIFKITRDETEAAASNHLKGKKLKHVVRISDVFKFPRQQSGTWYGITQEKLTPMTEHDQTEFEHARLFVTRHFADLENFKSVRNMWSLPWDEIRSRIMKNSEAVDEAKEGEEALATLERLGLPDVLAELEKNRVEYSDIHSGNFMRRGADLVVIDLGGSSKSPGKEPIAIEGAGATLREAKADQVGVTIGRFQPFHKGHATMIRDLTKKFSKVILIIAGNTKDKKNPFSYDLRLKMIQKSLPDVISKVEIHKAVYGGKNSGYVPGVLSDVAMETNSSVEGDTAVQIMVGQDRSEEIKKQLAHAIQAKEKGTELHFDPSLAVVTTLPDVRNDDDADRISGTKVRQALVQDQKDVVKSLMDSHLVSNPSDFEDVYAEMKKEMGGDSGSKIEAEPKNEILETVLDEVIADIGGESGVEEILQANKERLLKSKWKIKVDSARRLGGGKEGIAFDIGSGKVLKVTADPNEAKTSFGLVNKTNLKHVVHIFDVFGFPTLAAAAPVRLNAPAGQPKHPAYGIVTERLTDLSTQEKKEFDSFTEECQAQMGKQAYIDAIWTSNWPSFLQRMEQAFSKDIAKEGNLTPDNPRFQRVLKSRMERYTTLFEKYKVPDMMKELKSVGVKFADYHGGNLMKRGSEYVINDLGRSESPSKTEPPKLEGIVNNVIEQLTLEFAGDGLGSSQIGVRGGSSAVSSFKNRVDPNSKELWQNQLDRLQIKGSGSLPD